jgi:hypothetical protein
MALFSLFKKTTNPWDEGSTVAIQCPKHPSSYYNPKFSGCIYCENEKKELKNELSVMSNKDLIDKVHHEFMNASDALIKEAQEIIEKASTKNVEKAKRLEALGFRNVPQVQEFTVLNRQRQNFELILQSIEYYSFHYPQYKFITKDQVTSICEKYGLVLGNVGDYMGFVPEANLQQIENFKLRPEDARVSYESSLWRMGGMGGGRVDIAMSMKYYDDNIESNDVFKQREISRIRVDMNICAPLKDMDTRNKTVVNHVLVSNVPDPVVLCAVTNGYLIVTAWGDEASDELVQNPRNN